VIKDRGESEPEAAAEAEPTAVQQPISVEQPQNWRDLPLDEAMEAAKGKLGEIERKIEEVIDIHKPQIREAVKEVDRLRAAYDEAVHRGIPQETRKIFDDLRNARARLVEVRNVAKDQIFEQLRVDNGLDLKPSYASRVISSSPSRKATVEDGFRIVNSITDKDRIYSTKPVQVKATRSRAFQSSGTINLTASDGAATAAHELAHEIEERSIDVHNRCVEFLKRRTAGERSSYLGDRYSSTEYAKRDKFINPYTGKIYGTESNPRATEILSMGMTHLVGDPTEFMDKDPDHFRFVVGLLRGLF
jgi:hypothetical protein